MKIRDLTKKEAVDLLEWIYEATQCVDDTKLRDLMTGLNTLLPFCMVGGVLSKDHANGLPSSLVYAKNLGYPDGFVEEYAKKGLESVDASAIDCFGVYGIRYWKDSIGQHGIPEPLLGLLHDFDLKNSIMGHGYASGIRNVSGREKGVLGFSGLPRKSRHETILTLITPHLHEAMSRILGKQDPYPPDITAREKEILQWLMNGKSTWDISTILDISERTVKFHIDNIMRKLDAVNRTHAVAIALRQRIIDFE